MIFSISKRTGAIVAVLIVLLVSEVVAAPTTAQLPPLLAELHALLLAHPVLAPLLFVTAYSVAITLFFPGPLFCLLGGMLFGPWLGALLNVLGATLGAVLAFLLARHLVGALVEHHMGSLLQRTREGVAQQGWRFVAFVRLIPAVPYDLSCYLFGLSRIPLLPYAITTALCLLPRLTAYAYIGHSGRELLSGEGGSLLNLVSTLSLLVAVLLLPLLYTRHKHPLRP